MGLYLEILYYWLFIGFILSREAVTSLALISTYIRISCALRTCHISLFCDGNWVWEMHSVFIRKVMYTYPLGWYRALGRLFNALFCCLSTLEQYGSLPWGFCSSSMIYLFVPVVNLASNIPATYFYKIKAIRNKLFRVRYCDMWIHCNVATSKQRSPAQQRCRFPDNG